VRDGHPFLTQEFDEQRARQRAVLRSIPDWLFSPARFRPTNGQIDRVPPDDRPYVEAVVRAYADQLMKGAPMARWIEEVQAETAIHRLTQFVANEVPEPDRNLEAPWRSLIDDLVERRKEHPGGGPVDDDVLRVLPRMILLLCWADALGGDYADARFQ